MLIQLKKAIKLNKKLSSALILCLMSSQNLVRSKSLLSSYLR